MVEQFMALPLVTGSTPVVTATANPLIALHSAPSCPVGTSIRVRFYRSSGGYSQSTPRKSCVQGQTMNFYVAGMHANTQYTLISDLFSVSGSSSSAPLTFTTGTPTVSVNSYVVVGPSARLTPRVLVSCCNHRWDILAHPPLRLIYTETSSGTIQPRSLRSHGPPPVATCLFYLTQHRTRRTN